MTPTPRQATILAWLDRAYPHAGRLLASALWIAADERIPCRGRMVAHAYREICSMLMRAYSPNSREPAKTTLDQFVLEYRKLAISHDALAASSPLLEASRPPVTDAFLEAAAAVVRAHTTTETARARSRALFEGQSSRPGPQPDVQPTSDRWFRMSQFFTARAHDRERPDGEMMQGQFQKEADFFEETLHALAVTAVGNLDTLDDILEEANS